MRILPEVGLLVVGALPGDVLLEAPGLLGPAVPVVLLVVFAVLLWLEPPPPEAPPLEPLPLPLPPLPDGGGDSPLLHSLPSAALMMFTGRQKSQYPSAVRAQSMLNGLALQAPS